MKVVITVTNPRKFNSDLFNQFKCIKKDVWNPKWETDIELSKFGELIHQLIELTGENSIVVFYQKDHYEFEVYNDYRE